MPHRPDTLETVRLALELLKRIPRHRKVTAKELHAQLPDNLSRDVRTVQRQLEMLAEAFDIECDRTNRPYGYRWKERAPSLALPSLTDQESLMLALAEHHLRNLLPASLLQSLDGYFQQAHRRLQSPGSAKRERDWLGKVRVVRETLPLLPPKVLPQVFETVSNALYEDRWLTIDYRNAAGKRQNGVRVMPLGLAQQGPRLYLVARFEGYDNERSLAVHRIAKAAVGECFERTNFCLAAYSDEGRFGFGTGELLEVNFKISKAAGVHLHETPLSQDQSIIELESQLQVKATVRDSELLKKWLRGFGEEIEGISINRSRKEGESADDPCKAG